MKESCQKIPEIILKTGKEFTFFIVMDQDIKEQSFILFKSKISNYTSEVIISLLKDFKIYRKKIGLFSKASDVVVSGCSAGGLAAFHWANYIT